MFVLIQCVGFAAFAWLAVLKVREVRDVVRRRVAHRRRRSVERGKGGPIEWDG